MFYGEIRKSIAELSLKPLQMICRVHDDFTEQTYEINRIYDGVEAETRKSQARFQII